NRISDRLGANGRVKSHPIAGSRGHAGSKSGRVEWLRLAVDEQGRALWPEQEERAFFRADEVRIEARSGEIGDCPCMVGARIDYSLDRGRCPGAARVGQIALDFCYRQIVVFLAEQHQHRGARIRAGFRNRAKIPAWIERYVCGEPARLGIERRSQYFECGEMRHVTTV